VLLSSVDQIFQQLDHYDWIVYDFQFKDPTHVYDVSSPQYKQLFPQNRIQSEIFCSGFYAASKELFDQQRREQILQYLREGDAGILYPKAPDQTILNYMVMKLGLKSCNLALSLSDEGATGNSVTSPHFQEKDHLLYDHGKPLTYLHYIGISSKVFARVCAGENLDFPYRDIFLHYRYLHEPEKRPVFTSKPKPYNQPPSLFQRALKKLKLTR
ncbi:MAG: hypothetical protein SWJ54_14050, partial [Cyanobacteriota bacterium]|nr:hypothetical protein [Cyanobacteriota bacterium]